MSVTIQPSLHLALAVVIQTAKFKRHLRNRNKLQKVFNRLPSNQFDKMLSDFTTLVNVDSSFFRIPGYVIITCNSCFNWHLKESGDMGLDSFPDNEMVKITNWFDLNAPKVEELTVEITSQNYSVPEFINRMENLKVLSIKGHGDYPSKLRNISSIARLPNLTTIRFEHVSVSSLQPVFALINLKQLSFNMCEISDALMSFISESPHKMQGLTSLEFNMCYDLKQLPSGICNLVHLQKLSVTNCNELDVLPKRLGDLSNLESLSLRCCTKLQELPESIGSLRNMSLMDISDCLSISGLPEEIGELCGLQVFKMNGCIGLQELPMSISKLSQLQEVACDEETSYMWMDFESDLHNLKIDVVEDDRVESFMKIVR